MGNFCGYAVGADLRVGPFCDDETAPFHAVGAAICRPGNPVRGTRAHGMRPYRVMPPIQICAPPTRSGSSGLSGRGWGYEQTE